MQPFIVPSIFIAEDKYSSTLDKMANSTQRFNSKVESMHAKSTKAFNALTPSISEAGKQLLSYAGTAAVAAGIIGTAKFSVDSLMKYEDELANLQAVTGTSGLEFEKFKANINSVAKETNKSAVDVAAAFTAISNNQPELLKDADALAAVTKSSILLAKAAKMELQPAGEAITQILNQFGKGAKDAAKTVDILAAGSVAGSSEIRDTADAIQAFGTVAANMGIKINESVALIELGSKFEKGTEAGMKFRNILLEIGKGKAQDPKALADWKKWGVSIEVLTNKSLPLSTRLKEISKIRKDDVAIMHTFGKENAAMATGIMSTIDKFDGMVASVDTTGMASEMASKNMNTLRNRTEELKNAFINTLTSSDSLNSGLSLAKDTMQFFGEHMGLIVDMGVKVVGALALWKAGNLLLKASILTTKAISTVFYVTDMIKYVASTQGITFATAAWGVAQNSLNAFMLANPVGIFIAAIVLLAVAMKALHNRNQEILDDYQRRIELDLIKSMDAERNSVELLIDRYHKLGASMKDATLEAIKFKRGQIQSEKSDLNIKINENIATKNANNGFFEKTFGSEYDNASDALAKNREKEASLNARTSELNKQVVRSINAGDITSAEGSKVLTQEVASIKTKSPTPFNEKNIEQRFISPEEIMRTKEAINPKLAQQTAMTNMMNTTTNNAQATITVRNDSNSSIDLESSGSNKPVLPNTSSTHKMN